MANNFLELSTRECGDVYPIVRKNADRHFRVSMILSNQNEYPNAIAHLILGTEEFIKAFILLLEAKEFKLRDIPKYKHLFSNHRARHSIIKEFFSVWIFFRKLINVPARKQSQNQLVYYLQVIVETLNGAVDGANNYQWWDSADLLKQKCFYVDYVKVLLDPEALTRTQYEETYKHVMELRSDLRILMAGLSMANPDQLIQFRTDFETADFKSMLGKTLERSFKSNAK